MKQWKGGFENDPRVKGLEKEMGIREIWRRHIHGHSLVHALTFWYLVASFTRFPKISQYMIWMYINEKSSRKQGDTKNHERLWQPAALKVLKLDASYLYIAINRTKCQCQEPWNERSRFSTLYQVRVHKWSGRNSKTSLCLLGLNTFRTKNI